MTVLSYGPYKREAESRDGIDHGPFIFFPRPQHRPPGSDLLCLGMLHGGTRYVRPASYMFILILLYCIGCLHTHGMVVDDVSSCSRGKPCAGSPSVAAVPVAKAAGAGAARSTAAVINGKA